MPWGYVAGAVASSVVGSALAPSGGGGTSSGSSQPVYQPTSQAAQDANFNTSIGAYGNAVNANNNATSGYNNTLLGNAINNPYNETAQLESYYAQNQLQQAGGWAGQASNQDYAYANQQVQNAGQTNQLYQQGLGNVQNATNNLYQMGNQSNQQYQNLLNYGASQQPQITNSANNLYGAGNQVLQTSMDPQNALYNQQSQLNTDQTRAAEYARGIQSSPYGAAVENSSNQNFNTNWQNQQLARQTQGISAAQGAYGSAQGLGNSYTNNQAGLQAGENQQYAGLTGAAANQYTGYLNSMNQSNLSNTQNIAGAQQNAASLGSIGGQQLQAAGQSQYGTYQQQAGNQNQALQNYNSNNQPYLSGLNQLQSNDLGYMNFGQGAQNLGYQQNAQNSAAQAQAIGQISGPVGNALQNTNWANIFGGSGGGGQINSNFQLPGVEQGGYTAPSSVSDVFSGFTSG